MTPPTPLTPARRSHRPSLAAAAAMTGLLVMAQPNLAHAASTADEVKTTVLHPTISGTDGTVRYSLSTLAGGGVQVSFVYVPDEAAGEKSGRDQTQHKDFTLTVDAKAVATQTVVDDGDAVVPAASTGKDHEGKNKDQQKKDATEDQEREAPADDAAPAGAIVDQDALKNSTKITLQANTEGQQTVWVLPEQAPAAKDPDDQGWVTRTWHALVDKITGNDDDSSEDEDSTDQGEEAPSAAPTSSPSSSTTSSPTSSPTASSSQDSPSSSPSTSSPGNTPPRDEDACVITQEEPQLTTSTADDGTVNAPLEDGPSAAPTFSDEVRKKAAQHASDCGEGTDTTGESTDSESSDTSGASSTPSSGKTKVKLQAGDWLSGISGERAAAEQLRGVDAEVATTWADDSGNVDQLNDGAEFGADKWDKSLILGIPPFPQGSSWEATAAGDNDDYARKTFTSLKQKWGDRDGQAFVEWGYEMNGYWMWWNAKAGQEDAVAKSFARVRAIQQEVFPEALLGVRFNHESNGYDGNSEDLIAAVKPSIDFIGASYYNAYPPVFSQAEFDERATMRDGGGGPKGIGTWLAAAKAAGMPIEFGEWAESAKDGDSAPFIDGMHQTFKDNAGPGAGQVFAESYFNIEKDNDNWRINSGRVPQSAAAYGKAFSDVG